MSILVRYTAVMFTFMLGATAAYAGNHDEKCPPLTGQSEQKLKLTVAEYHLSINNKKPICIAMGIPVNVKIHIPGNSDIVLEKGDVTAEQKYGAPFKISGDNSIEADTLKLSIEAFDTDPGDDSECGDETEDECGKFWIKVKGVGELDPRVRVVEGSVQMGNHRHILQEVLDDLDITKFRAEDIIPEPQEGAN